MTPRQICLSIAPHLLAGLVESDNRAGYWLELMLEMEALCAATVGDEASRVIVTHLKSEVMQ